MAKSKTPEPTADELIAERASLLAAARRFQPIIQTTEAAHSHESRRIADYERQAKYAPIENVPHFEHQAKEARAEMKGLELFRAEIETTANRIRDRLKQVNDALRSQAAAV